MDIKVVIVDPSLFTIPYDVQLCNGLVSVGLTVSLFGRPLEDNEILDLHKDVDFFPCFYRFEKLNNRLPKVLLQVLKGASHIVWMRSLDRILKSVSPDIIHFQWSVLPFVDLLVLDRFRKIAPLVLTVHDTQPFNGSPSSFLQTIGFKKLVRKFDHLVVHTDQGKKRLIDLGISHECITMIPHGILQSHNGKKFILTPKKYMGKVSKSEDESVKFLLFGQIKPYKGVDILIRAITLIPPDKRSCYKFIVAGKPYVDVNKLKKLAKDLNVVEYITFLPNYFSEDEVDALFDDASVLLFPYREIEASGVLMRSLEFCKPIIASRLGAFSEMLQDGKHGRLVKPGDEKELAAAIVNVGSDVKLREEMAKNIKGLTTAIPSWQDVAGQTQKMYATMAY